MRVMRTVCRHHGHAVFGPRGGGVTCAALDVGDFADAVWRDGGDDGGGLADEVGDPRFAGALGPAEHSIEQPEHKERQTKAAGDREWRANPDIRGCLEIAEDDAKSSKRGHEACQDQGAEEGNPGHAAVVKASFGVAAGADVAAIMAADEMTKDGAGHYEEQSDHQAESIDKHRRLVRSCRH